MIHKKNAHSTETIAVRKTDFLRLVPVAVFVAVMSLTSCVKDELFNTPHPDHGKIILTTDWTERMEGVEVPASWKISIGDYAAEETGAVHEADRLFEPGDYRIIAYNPVDDITVSGTTASVASGNGKNGFISGTPGILFTYVQDVTIEKDKNHAFTATMHQQTGRLTLIIEPTGDAASRIESIEGILSGAAGTMDFATGTYGAPSNVALHFTKITEGENAGKWTATVWLLGVTGDAQRLSAAISYTGGNPQPTILTSDLTGDLKDFNSDKTEALTLGGSIVETPAEGGFSATITVWEIAENGNVEIN